LLIVHWYTTPAAAAAAAALRVAAVPAVLGQAIRSFQPNFQRSLKPLTKPLKDASVQLRREVV